MTEYFPKEVVGTMEPLSLEDFIEYLNSEIVFTDIDSIKSAHKNLQRVCSDPSWFIDFLNSELASNMESDELYGNRYTSNSYLLGRSKKEQQFIIRANTWLPVDDPLRSDIDKSLFAEDLLHDHTFDLLTGGLLGPGYRTKIYHYEYDRCIGYVGEEVPFSAEHDFQLSQGSALFMEKNKTIHRQLPPDNISVSLNVLCQNLVDPTKRQYEFENSSPGFLKVKSIHYSTNQNPAATETIVNICGTFFNEETKQILVDMYNRLIVDPGRNEPCIIMLLEWFRKREVDISALNPVRVPLSSHLKREMDLMA